MKTITRNLILGALCLLAVAPMSVQAGRNADRVEDALRLKARRQATATQDLNAVRLQGEIRVNSRGATLDGAQLRFTGRTTVFPGVNDGRKGPNPKSLRGKEATVYGRRVGNAIMVSLIILDEDPQVTDVGVDGLVDGNPTDPDVYRIPSESDDTVGELKEDVPQ